MASITVHSAKASANCFETGGKTEDEFYEDKYILKQEVVDNYALKKAVKLFAQRLSDRVAENVRRNGWFECWNLKASSWR